MLRRSVQGSCDDQAASTGDGWHHLRMRSLVYLVATTIDGFITGPDRGDPDFFPFEGPHVADLLAEFPEMIPGHLREHVGLVGAENRRFDTVLMGRTTYGVGLQTGVTSPYPHLRQ